MGSLLHFKVLEMAQKEIDEIEKCCENCENDAGEGRCYMCGYNHEKCGDDWRFFFPSREAIERNLNKTTKGK